MLWNINKPFFLWSNVTIYYNSTNKLFHHCAFWAQISHVNCTHWAGKINIKLLSVQGNIQWLISYIRQGVMLHALWFFSSYPPRGMRVTFIWPHLFLVWFPVVPLCMGHMRIGTHLSLLANPIKEVEEWGGVLKHPSHLNMLVDIRN